MDTLQARRTLKQRRAFTHTAEIEADLVAALRKALEDIRSRSSINLAMRSDQFELTARLGDIHQIAGAALEQEERQ